MAERIIRLKVQAVNTQPFYAAILLRHKLIEDGKIPTAATNGREVLYNEGFMMELPEPQALGVFLHEVLHIALLHPLRCAGKNMQLWNVACDMICNWILSKISIQLPKNCIHHPLEWDGEMKNLTAELIYQRLLKDCKGGKPGNLGKPGDEPGEPQQYGTPFDKLIDDPSLSDSDKAVLIDKIKTEVTQAVHAAKKAGKLSAEIERACAEMLKPIINWQSVLSQFVSQVDDSDYSWSHPSRRYCDSDFVLPGLFKEKIGNIAIMVDVSGSISAKQYQRFQSESCAIIDHSAFETTVQFIDTQIKHTCSIEDSVDVASLKPTGGGGTSFRPGFEYYENCGENPTAVVYFTDGACEDFPDFTPSYPVIWVLFEPYNTKFKPPFGQVLITDIR